MGDTNSSPQTIFLDAVAPGIFTVNQEGSGLAAALHEDGITPVSADNPAHPNEIITLFATGLGTLTPALGTGEPSVGNETMATPTITIDGVTVIPEYSGAAPGYLGLNQINVRVPTSTHSATDIPVALTVDGKQSNTVTIPVSP